MAFFPFWAKSFADNALKNNHFHLCSRYLSYHIFYKVLLFAPSKTQLWFKKRQEIRQKFAFLLCRGLISMYQANLLKLWNHSVLVDLKIV